MTSEQVLSIFREITRIPRESGHEGPMTDYLVSFAKDRGLQYKRDATGNVLICKPASPGREGVPTLVLQAHQDMVCEKVPTSGHDFLKDPIPFVIEDGWMVSHDTTLGADDGIGIAACLALLESGLPTGQLECLFTISEETGMDGAMALEEGFFTGKTLINLDSEDEGQLFVGCAGGVNTLAEWEFTPVPVAPGRTIVSLHVGGAQGGHSGDDINKERCNTVQQLARFLYEIVRAAPAGEAPLQLISIDGGGKHNAIARDCVAKVAVGSSSVDALTGRFEEFGKALGAEFGVSDPGVFCKATREGSTAPGQTAIDYGTVCRVVSALVAVHHGVLSMSREIPGLVQTSNNLASVKTEPGGRISVVTSQRSSSMSERDFVADKVEACLRLSGAETRRTDPYPGWKPDLSSRILAVSVASYRKLFGVDPEVKAIHAGLECGLFLEKFPGLDMISFGPTLRGVHAPGEKLDLASNDKFVAHLVDVVTNWQ